MPASVLIASPWFQSNDINGLEDAVSVMRTFIEGHFDKQDIGLVSMSMMESMNDGNSLYGSLESHKKRMSIDRSNDALLSREMEMSMSIDDYKNSSFVRRADGGKKRERK